MEKIKLELEKREFITKKFANQDIKIIPYIELEEVGGIVDILVQNILENKEESDMLLSTEDKIVLLMQLNNYVVDNCSSVDVENMDYEILTTSGIEEYILKFIANYQIAKTILFESINEYNQALTIISMFDSLPNGDEMKTDMEKMVRQLNNIDKDKLKLVTNAYINNIVQDEVKQEKQIKQLKLRK